jgi:hypothetical protein
MGWQEAETGKGRTRETKGKREERIGWGDQHRKKKRTTTSRQI